MKTLGWFSGGARAIFWWALALMFFAGCSSADYAPIVRDDAGDDRACLAFDAARQACGCSDGPAAQCDGDTYCVCSSDAGQVSRYCVNADGCFQ